MAKLDALVFDTKVANRIFSEKYENETCKLKDGSGDARYNTVNNVTDGNKPRLPIDQFIQEGEMKCLQDENCLGLELHYKCEDDKGNTITPKQQESCSYEEIIPESAHYDLQAGSYLYTKDNTNSLVFYNCNIVNRTQFDQDSGYYYCPPENIYFDSTDTFCSCETGGVLCKYGQYCKNDPDTSSRKCEDLPLCSESSGIPCMCSKNKKICDSTGDEMKDACDECNIEISN